MEESISKRGPTLFTSSSGFVLPCFKEGPPLPNFHLCEGDTFEIKKNGYFRNPEWRKGLWL